MRLDINLATRSYINLPLVNSLIWSATVILLLFMICNVKGAISGTGELNRLKADIVKYETQLNTRPAGVSEQEFIRMQTDIKFYNAIIVKKSRDWLGLLDKLESSTPEGVSLTSLAPDSKSGEIKLEGKARSFTVVRNYLEKLEGSGYFRDVLLVSHQNAALNERSSGVQFNITCRVVAR